MADTQEDRQKLIAEIEALEIEILANLARNTHAALNAGRVAFGEPRPSIECVSTATRDAFRAVNERLVDIGIPDPVLAEYGRFFIDDEKAILALRLARATLIKAADGTCPTCGGERLAGDKICGDCSDI